MCIPKTPDIPKVQQPTKEVAVSSEDSINTQLQQDNKRRGFASTLVNGGSGLTTQANIKKTQLGT
jgi:hypothetical protein